MSDLKNLSDADLKIILEKEKSYRDALSHSRLQILYYYDESIDFYEKKIKKIEKEIEERK